MATPPYSYAPDGEYPPLQETLPDTRPPTSPDTPPDKEEVQYRGSFSPAGVAQRRAPRRRLEVAIDYVAQGAPRTVDGPWPRCRERAGYVPGDGRALTPPQTARAGGERTRSGRGVDKQGSGRAALAARLTGWPIRPPPKTGTYMRARSRAGSAALRRGEEFVRDIVARASHGGIHWRRRLGPAGGQGPWRTTVVLQPLAPVPARYKRRWPC